MDEVADVLISMLDEGPAYYPDGEVTDEPTETLVGELIREAALEGGGDELPHSIAVEIDEMGLRAGRPDDRPLLDIYASLVVERDSQKPIMIGRGGEHIKQVGTDARRQISALLGHPSASGPQGEGAQGVAARSQTPQPVGFLSAGKLLSRQQILSR